MHERAIGVREPERVRALLRGVSYPEFSRDSVGAGRVGEIVTKGLAVEIQLQQESSAEKKVE